MQQKLIESLEELFEQNRETLKDEVIALFEIELEKKDEEISQLKNRLIKPSLFYADLIDKIIERAKQTPFTYSDNWRNLLEAAGHDIRTSCEDTDWGNGVHLQLETLIAEELVLLDEDTLWFYVNREIFPDLADEEMCDLQQIVADDLIVKVCRKGEEYVDWLDDEQYREKSFYELKSLLLERIAQLKPEVVNSSDLLFKEISEFVRFLPDGNSDEIITNEINDSMIPERYREAWENGDNLDEDHILTEILLNVILDERLRTVEV